MDNMHTLNAHSVQSRKGKIKNICANTILSIVLIIGCIWILLNVFSFSRTENTSTLSERNLIDEYEISTENFKKHALEGIYNIELTYLIPDTQIIAPEPDERAFGYTTNKSDLQNIALKAEEYGLIDIDELHVLTDSAPWSEQSEAEYYIDKSILTITWKSEIGHHVVNFSEVVISHPSQFRKYLTENKFASEKRKTVSSISSELNAVVGMSADYYAYRHIGAVVQNRIIYRDNLIELDNCFVDETGNLLFLERNSITEEHFSNYIDQNNIVFSLSFGPILVKDSELYTDYRKGYPIGQIYGDYARAAIGQLGEKHYLLCTIDGGAISMGKKREGATVEEMAVIMHNMGCINAYTLDGGQTATMTVNGKVFNKVGYGSERPVSDIIFFATAIPKANRMEAPE